MNQPRLSGIVRLIRITFAILIWFHYFLGHSFLFIFITEAIFDRWRDAVLRFYQAISAVTNSGFDVTGDSIKPFAHDYFFSILIMFLDFCRRNWFSCIDGVPGNGYYTNVPMRSFRFVFFLVLPN